MPKFLFELNGQSEGCDYTIGCNRKNILLEADSLDQAAILFRQLIEDQYSGFTKMQKEYGWFDITIYQVVDQTEAFDMKKYVSYEKEKVAREEQIANEKRERALLETLRKKYGG